MAQAHRSSDPATGPSRSATPYVLREHALLADGERGALMDPQGGVQWLCVPRWHDEPVFAGLLGGPGHYLVTPTDPWHTWGGYYEDGSLVWRGRWVCSDSIIECDAALAHPADTGRVVLLSRIRAVQGDAEVDVELRPADGFHEDEPPRFRRRGDVWFGEVGATRVRWQGAAHARRADDGSLALKLRVAEGQEHDLVLEISREDLPDDAPDARTAWSATRDAWQRTVPDMADLPAAEDLRLSYAVLAGLTSRDHGMVAAATMSLPERTDQGENYDYRYAWIRDQCYAGQAVAALGPYPLLDSALSFVTDRILADRGDLKPAYTVDGGPVPDERHVHVPGYPGGGDVVGNWVNRQFQLDAFGEALSLYAGAAGHDLLQPRHWEAVRVCVDVIEERRHDPEAGIWELENDLWTHSRLACVAGLRAIARRTERADAARWSALADTIVAEVGASSLHPSGRWQQSPSRPGVDAALLLPPVRGALPADDPRTVATRRAVVDELTRNGHVYRFRHDERPLADAEGSFTLCGFVLALAEAHAGHLADAVHYYERARSTCATSGLFAEEFDTRQHQLRGNLPQAFVHATFIEATVRLAELRRTSIPASGDSVAGTRHVHPTPTPRPPTEEAS